MKFTVAYRNERGALMEETVEAKSRNECLALMRMRGIVPSNIKEEDFGSRRAHRGGGRPKCGVKTMIWGLFAAFAALIAACSWWWLSAGQVRIPSAEASKKTALPKEVKPARAQRLSPEPERKEKIEKPKFMDTVPYSEMTTHQKRDRARYLAKLALRDNKFGVDVQTADPNDKPMLTNAIHMSFIKYMQPGSMVPPPMVISDEEAYAACSMPVNYSIDDSEEVLLWKSQVEEQLKEMKAYMDQGHSAMEYYELLDRRQQTEAATMNEARTTIYELTRQGKYDEAEETVNAFNAYLSGKGLPTIRLSPKVRHELKRRRAAKKERGK